MHFNHSLIPVQLTKETSRDFCFPSSQFCVSETGKSPTYRRCYMPLTKGLCDHQPNLYSVDVALLTEGAIASRCRFYGSMEMLPHDLGPTGMNDALLLINKLVESYIRSRVALPSESSFNADNPLSTSSLTILTTLVSIYTRS
jgi:hypothetical protein